jgi:hypothetical protein
MKTGKLWNDSVFLTVIVVPGGVLVVLGLMTAFVVVGQVLLMVRRRRASRFQGETRPFPCPEASHVGRYCGD